MTNKSLVAAVLGMFLVTFSALAQDASELLQKGLHLQEAAGDVDGAIVFFRQVVNSAASTNKSLAAQAQYQLVLCMLQKADRAAAQKELAALENNFAGMRDLIEKARKLLPGTASLLSEPWGENESEQLNIKRDGVATSEYLYYSADAYLTTLLESNRKQTQIRTPDAPELQAVYLRWELKTKRSERSIQLLADRDTLQGAKRGRNEGEGTRSPEYESDDALGDSSAAPFAGPATDAEESVFLLRRLPLAVGFKATIPVTSNTLAPVQMEFAVTGIEAVQTPAGKFNCYKVAFHGIGQTFWIGVEGARPFVKWQNSAVEAELVKSWGPDKVLDSIVAAATTGGIVSINMAAEPGGIASARGSFWNNCCNNALTFTYRKRLTPQNEIASLLERRLDEEIHSIRIGGRNGNYNTGLKLRSGSLQERSIGGNQAITGLLDYMEKDVPRTVFVALIASESSILEIWANLYTEELGTFRWRFEPILDAIRIP